MDAKSKRNLEGLDIAVLMARETASKTNVYKTNITKSGIYKQPNTEQNRQIDLNGIDTYKGKKTSGILVRRIYKKYHIMKYHDFVKKLQKIIQKRPEALVPYSDFAKGLPPHVIATFSKPQGKHKLPTIALEQGIPKKVFNNMAKDFTAQLHTLLPKEDWEIMDKPA